MRKGCFLSGLLHTPHPPFTLCVPPHTGTFYLFMQPLLRDIPVWLTASLGPVCFHPHFCDVLILSRSANCTDMTIITDCNLQSFVFGSLLRLSSKPTLLDVWALDILSKCLSAQMGPSLRTRITSLVERGGSRFEFWTSRSEERGMNNLQRKPNKLQPFGNGKNVKSDGSSWARESDKGCVCFSEQWPVLFPTVVSRCVQFSSLEQQFITVLWFRRREVGLQSDVLQTVPPRAAASGLFLCPQVVMEKKQVPTLTQACSWLLTFSFWDLWVLPVSSH